MSGSVLKYDDHTQRLFKLVQLKPAVGEDKEHPHRHNFYQIFLFTEDSGSHTIEEEKYAANRGSVHIVNSGNVHSLERSRSASGFVLLFTGAFFERGELSSSLFLFRNDFKPVLQPESRIFKRLIDNCQAITEESNQNEGLRDDAIRGLLKYLLIQIHREIDFREFRSHEPDEVYTRYVQLVERNYTREHKLITYASQLGVTTSALNRLVKRSVGKTANQILQDRLILECKRMLTHSEYSIKEIAYSLGYSDPAYFIRFFRNKTGTTPGSFRQNKK